jgi:hypothetical protein
MHEVRVESLDKLEFLGGEVRVAANSGESDEVNLVFPKHVWDEILLAASETREPDGSELEEIHALETHLRSFAKEHSFATILEDVPRGGAGDLPYDLVLRSDDLYAVTTGYVFGPTLGSETVEAFRAALARDDFVEQAYLVGAVTEGDALLCGDDDVKVVCMRERKSSVSRFEMTPELWRTLSEKLGWTNMKTVIPENKG